MVLPAQKTKMASALKGFQLLNQSIPQNENTTKSRLRVTHANRAKGIPQAPTHSVVLFLKGELLNTFRSTPLFQQLKFTFPFWFSRQVLSYE